METNPAPEGTKSKKITRTEATNRYDLVLNVDSLTSCIHGWRVGGKLVDRLDDISTLTLLARTVAIVGPYKVGKTFVARHISDSDIVDDQIIQTYGVSMVLPKNSAQQAAEEVEDDDEDSFSMRPTEDLPTTSRPVTEVAVLDTAGTDRTTAGTYHLLLSFLIQHRERHG